MKKTTVFRLVISPLLALMPFAAVAQSNIKTAFDAIINCPGAEVKDSHSLYKDPVKHNKVGSCDTYEFELPAGKSNLIKNVISAFDRDSEKSYSLIKSWTEKNGKTIGVAVGDGSNIVALPAGHEYLNALFMAQPSEDPAGIYRYAYVIAYKEKPDGRITGRIAITYAQTIEYRQKMNKEAEYENLRRLNDLNRASTFDVSQKTWFDGLMTYLQNMHTASVSTRISLATKAYKQIGEMNKYPVTEVDKATAREILKAMISDSKYSETVLNKLLQKCLAGIK